MEAGQVGATGVGRANVSRASRVTGWVGVTRLRLGGVSRAAGDCRARSDLASSKRQKEACDVATRQGPSAAFPKVHSLVSGLAEPLAPASAGSPYPDPGKGMQLSGQSGGGQGGPTHRCWSAAGAGVGGMHGRGRPRGTGDEILPRMRAAIFVLLVLRKIPSTCRSSRTSTGHVLCARHGGCTGARGSPALMKLMF